MAVRLFQELQKSYFLVSNLSKVQITLNFKHQVISDLIPTLALVFGCLSLRRFA